MNLLLWSVLSHFSLSLSSLSLLSLFSLSSLSLLSLSSLSLLSLSSLSLLSLFSLSSLSLLSLFSLSLSLSHSLSLCLMSWPHTQVLSYTKICTKKIKIYIYIYGVCHFWLELSNQGSKAALLSGAVYMLHVYLLIVANARKAGVQRQKKSAENCVSVCVRGHTYICIYIYMHIHVCIYIYTHICMCMAV